eukprot:TRINITY_DN3057_c0_g1_i2.p1 TRINITY_DN3057_c0_g1~~TRINITY_DN3057_c0_g1_i2.p1  ORF type:complete len:403 (+),score=58.32 TRINITY_DN3057_c0_g1_i2:36-1211(+)
MKAYYLLSCAIAGSCVFATRLDGEGRNAARVDVASADGTFNRSSMCVDQASADGIFNRSSMCVDQNASITMPSVENFKVALESMKIVSWTVGALQGGETSENLVSVQNALNVIGVALTSAKDGWKAFLVEKEAIVKQAEADGLLNLLDMKIGSDDLTDLVLKPAACLHLVKRAFGLSKYFVDFAIVLYRILKNGNSIFDFLSGIGRLKDKLEGVGQSLSSMKKVQHDMYRGAKEAKHEMQREEAELDESLPREAEAALKRQKQSTNDDVVAGSGKESSLVEFSSGRLQHVTSADEAAHVGAGSLSNQKVIEDLRNVFNSFGVSWKKLTDVDEVSGKLLDDLRTTVTSLTSEVTSLIEDQTSPGDSSSSHSVVLFYNWLLVGLTACLMIGRR